MKRGLAWIVCALLAACALSLCSCNTLSELQNAVRYPDAYTLSYEVTDSEGTVTTVTKTVKDLFVWSLKPRTYKAFGI